MSQKVICKNGKSFTYLNPGEKALKYGLELSSGYKMGFKDSNIKVSGTAKYIYDKNSNLVDIKFSDNYQDYPLTDRQRQYRKDYINAFNSYQRGTIKNSNSPGAKAFQKELEVFNKFYNREVVKPHKNN